MNNKELYKNTFSQIHASNEKVTEVIKMSETKKKRKLVSKKLIAIAACVACVASAGIVANAATDGELGKTVMGWFISDDGKQTAIEGDVSYDENGNKTTTATLDNGNKLTLKEDSETGDEYYEYSVDDEEAKNKKFMISVDENNKATIEYDDKYSEEAVFGDKNTTGDVDETPSKNSSDIVE